MKTCTNCNKIHPDGAFYRRGSWCTNCRTEKRAEWKAANKANDKAQKLLSQTNHPDPTAYGKLHCEHIAAYTKRAIERFERKTNKEAPPELSAIHQLAQRLTDEQHAQLVTRQVVTRGSRVVDPPKPGQCDHCGKTYTPSPRAKRQQRFCSDNCRDRFNSLTNPEYVQAKRERERRRNEQRYAPQRALRKAEREARRIKRQDQEERRLLEREARKARAQQAATMRIQGHTWKTIAATLGYKRESDAFLAVRYIAKTDPTQLAGHRYKHGTASVR